MKKKILVLVCVMMLSLIIIGISGQVAKDSGSSTPELDQSIERALNYDKECNVLDNGKKRCSIKASTGAINIENADNEFVPFTKAVNLNFQDGNINISYKAPGSKYYEINLKPLLLMKYDNEIEWENIPLNIGKQIIKEDKNSLWKYTISFTNIDNNLKENLDYIVLRKVSYKGFTDSDIDLTESGIIIDNKIKLDFGDLLTIDDTTEKLTANSLNLVIDRSQIKIENLQPNFIDNKDGTWDLILDPTVSAGVSQGADDAEEDDDVGQKGGVEVTSSDLELGVEGSVEQTVGTRFQSVNIPQGATITNAYINFTVDEISTGSLNLTIYGQDSDDTAEFTTATFNISSRPKTTATIDWNNVPDWNTVGVVQTTPDISSIIQEIVNRAGWSSGNSIVIVVNHTLVAETNARIAESYESGASTAPLLFVEYTTSVEYANEQEGDNAIQSGIESSEIWTAAVYDSYQISGANMSHQFNGRFDKVALKGNKRWALNYVSSGESAITGIFNITPTLYVLQLQDLTSEAITVQVSSFINSTYP